MDNILFDLLQERVLVLDGAMGTMIQCLSPVKLSGNNEALIFEQPGLIARIHDLYLEAGADIITTNTFNANAISQEEYGLQDRIEEMNARAAALAADCCRAYEAAHGGSRRFVAGSIGPTNKSASMSSDPDDPSSRSVDFDRLAAAYREQVRGLMAGGVDILLVETIFDTLNAKAALFAIEQVCEEKALDGFPVMLSATVADDRGRLLSGQDLEAFVTSVSHAKLLSIGLNCSFGSDRMAPFAAELSRLSPCGTSAHPNAGLPDAFGRYTHTPEIMVHNLEPYLNNRWVNIIGGCCGTTPEHIAAIARAAAKAEPRPWPAGPALPAFSGWERVELSSRTPFLRIGERTNVSGSRRFARFIREEQYDKALDIAVRMLQDGAQIIDLNVDDPLIDAPAVMKKFLLLMGSEPSVAKAPVMIDSSQWPVIETALTCLQGKSIVNSLSLKEGEEEFCRRASFIRRCGAAVVVMAFDEEGQATDYERKIAVCERAYRILTQKAAFNPRDIIFDPNVLAIATGMEEDRRYAMDFIRAVRYIKTRLPGALVSGGISNLSFAFRGNDSLREAMHSVFLHHCRLAGMDMAIVKPGAQPPYGEIPSDLRRAIEDVIFDTDSQATRRLVSVATRMTAEKGGGSAHKTVADDAWRLYPPEERLIYALLHGEGRYLEEDLQAASESSDAMNLIEGPLVEGMNRVGKLFNQGKLFLPQIVKSARVMKQAAALLQPRIRAEKKAQGEDGIDHVSKVKIVKGVFATVKGDVHDIGKNLAITVMECGNYRIADLGVMVPASDIIGAVAREKAQFLCLSGLITPSLEEMIRVVAAMDAAACTIPIFIGGATTSEEFTALRIAPRYRGPVLYAADASQGLVMLNRYFGREREAFCREVKDRYAKLRQKYREQTAARLQDDALVPLSQARGNRLVLGHSPAFSPQFTGVREYRIPYRDLRARIAWEAFFDLWGSRKNEATGSVRERLREEAETLLDSLEAQDLYVHAVAGFFPARSDHQDNILVFAPGDASADSPLHTFVELRNQQRQPSGLPNLSLADFISPSGRDFIGLFALRASGPQTEERLEALRSAEDIDQRFLLQSLLDRLAEAASLYLHRLLLPGGGIRPAFGYPSCPDHSEKAGALRLLGALDTLSLRMTENYMLSPVSSLCGLYFGRPEARYFGVGPLAADQQADYCRRKNIDFKTLQKLLGPSLC